MKTSTLVLNDISVVDHAYIDNEGKIVGGSWNPCFRVTGIVDPAESVVVDFSTIKKDIKKIIDAHEDGFDHKLHIFKDSKCSITLNNKSAHIINDQLELGVTRDSVKVIDCDYNQENVGNAMAKQVLEKLQEQHPGVTDVKCINSIHAHLDGTQQCSNYFRYVHGLKDSTSYGCQNNSHGHLSVITFDQYVPTIATKIMGDIDNTIFINKENIVAEDEDNLSIEYSCKRGIFTATYSKKLKLVILDTETTVEFLGDYIVNKYKDELSSLDVAEVVITEGLSKGVVINI